MYLRLEPNKCAVVLALCIGGLLAGCARRPEDRASAFLERGKRQMAKRDYARAVLEFRNAVQSMPRDAELHYNLGLALLAAGRVKEAAGSLQKATELNPTHIGAQVKLAELMARTGIPIAVRESEQRMQDLLRTAPDNLDVIETLALAEFRLGKVQDAEKHLQQALDKFPQSLQAAVALARFHAARRDWNSAEEVLKKAAGQAPKSAEAATALGEIYLLASRWSDAERQFREVLGIDGKHAGALLGLAEAQLRLGQRDRAEETNRKISEIPEFKHVYGLYLFSAGKREEALREFARLVRTDPKDRAARNRLVTVYVLMNRVPEAEKIVATALKANGRDLDALLQHSFIALRSGRVKEAETDLNRFLHYEATSPMAHYLLANVYRMTGNAAGQRQQLSEALRFNPGLLSARLELAQSLLEANSASAALNTLDGAPAEQKKHLAFWVQRNWALLALDDRAQARKAISQGLASTRSPDLLLQDGVLKLIERDYAGARASANEALQKAPGDVRAARVLMSAYTAEKQPAAALRALQRLAAQNPKSAPMQELLGDWLQAGGDRVQARAAFEAARSAQPGWPAAELKLAGLDITEGKLEAARSRLNARLSSNADDVDARLLLASAELRARNRTVAIEHYRKIVAENPRHVIALNNFAYLLAETGDQSEEALQFAQKARELAPEDINVAGTLGWVLYSKALYPSALKYLQEAVTKDGRSQSEGAAIRKYHLGLTCLKTGDRSRGYQLVQEALAMKPGLPEDDLRMAQAVLHSLGR